MATFDAQLREIEYLVQHGKPRAKKQGIEQARALFNSLASERQSIEVRIDSKADTASDLEGLRSSVRQLDVHMSRLQPLLRIA